jgi:ABC-2 type transport system permease protein
MFSRIFRHEWRMLVTDPSAWFALAAFGVAIGYALLNNSAAVRRQQQGVRQCARESEERLDDIKRRAQEIERQIAEGRVKETTSPSYGPRHPVYVIAWGRQTAALPPAPLAALAAGQSDLYPAAYEVATNTPLEAFAVTEQTEYPLKLLVGNFDFAFVIVYLYPLLIIALGFNLMTAEKEGGTLGLLLAQPVRLRTLALAKVAARAALVFGSAVVFLTAGLLFSEIGWRAEGVAPALLLVLLIVLFYGAFWLGLCVLVNAYSRSSAAAALVLIICWLVLAVLVPSSLNFAATALYPMPSRADFVSARRAADAAARQQTAQLVERFFDAHPEFRRDGEYPELGKQYVGNAAEAEEMERRMQPVRARFVRQLTGQQSLLDRLRFFSPVILARDALHELAGAGRDRRRLFLSQINAYQQSWRQFFWPRTFMLPPMSPASFDRIPRFTFREEPFSVLIRRAAVPAAALALITLVIGWAGLRAYRSFPSGE